MRKVWMPLAILALWACNDEQPANGHAKRAAATDVAMQAAENAVSTANVTTREPHSYSRFTSIEPDQCHLIEENLEEGGWWRRSCEGAAGYKLELSESDLRQDIVVIATDGRRWKLGLSQIVANGAFNSLGKTAEWRGADPSGPDALIVRLGVASDPEGKKPDISKLVVVRLKPPICIVAVVPPGADQNAQARVVADGNPRSCLRG